MNQSVIDAMISFRGSLNIGLFFVNPLINPGNKEYLNYYFEDKNTVSFTQTSGAHAIARVQDFTIETDESLLPFRSNKVDKGVVIPENIQIVPFQITSNHYASFYFMKSSQSVSYSRKFNKID